MIYHFVKKCTLPCVILIMSSQLSKLIEWFKLQRTEYIGNGPDLFRKRKEFLICTLIPHFLKSLFLSGGNL